MVLLNQFSRAQLLLGQEAMKSLANAKIAVFGIGGVGGHVTEALARSGVGFFVLVDHDKVSLTNLNRQIIATRSTIGKYKVDVMKERILDINPEAQVEVHKCFYLPENKDEFDFLSYDYVVDAVDTVTAKLCLILQAQEEGVPVISSMGAGNKLDPTKFQIADIYKTSMCPLAKVMRRELKKREVKRLKVVFSTEPPVRPEAKTAGCFKPDGILPMDSGSENTERRAVPGSVAFVPAVAGLLIAGEVTRDLIDINRT